MKNCFHADICKKSEGRELDGPCKSNGDCQPGCPGKKGLCDRGRCWCIDSSSLDDITPNVIPQIANRVK